MGLLSPKPQKRLIFKLFLYIINYLPRPDPFSFIARDATPFIHGYSSFSTRLVSGYHSRNVFLDSADGLDIEFLNQHVGHTGRQKARQCRSQTNALDAQG